MATGEMCSSTVLVEGTRHVAHAQTLGFCTRPIQLLLLIKHSAALVVPYFLNRILGVLEHTCQAEQPQLSKCSQ
jgi:hypothetical protein